MLSFQDMQVTKLMLRLIQVVNLVYDFIDAHSRVWKESLIRSTFPKEIASRILKIPLANEVHNDIQVWREEPSEEFLIKSAYKLLHSSSFSSNLINTHHDPSDYYKKLWQYNSCQKLKLIYGKLPRISSLLLLTFIVEGFEVMLSAQNVVLQL